MKIAIVCPVGDLRRFGYWRHALECLESWRALGDLFLICSSRAAIPFDIPARVIRGKWTLMELDNGAERFDHRIVASNANGGLEAARQAGYDCALTICVNWYVESAARFRIAEKCQYICQRGLSHAFLCRRLHMNGALFDADRESIALFNLRRTHGAIVKVLVDRAEIDGAEIESRRGDYSGLNDEAYIDCEFEITRDEMRAKMFDVRNYEDILAKRAGNDWPFWEQYFIQRIAALKMSDDPLGEIGQRIAAYHPADALSDWLLNQVAANV